MSTNPPVSEHNTQQVTSETKPGSVNLSCHCGRVKITIPSPPEKINECRCSICYRYGALWAYYDFADVAITASPPELKRDFIREEDFADKQIAFCFCGQCGCLTHWEGIPEVVKKLGPAARMGVNCRMLPESAIDGVERKVSYE